ncbi:MAG: DUF6493 family protein [Arachnia propionica]|uniref:DUF7824 domain-containing protein n=1 Tax=Arachnia propionica TaxID=1750 RepID=UPI0027092E97|nr:DUF6493 family protein [Arachnia propionica]
MGLDDDALTELIAEVAENWLEHADLTERALAQLVATAHARGPEPVVAACRESTLSSLAFLFGYSGRLLQRLGDGTIRPGTTPRPARSPRGPLVFLAAQHFHDVLHRLGELPCLLSTPSNSRYEVTAQDLRDRVEQYNHDNVVLEPTDVAIALARLRRTDDHTGIDAPIRGCELRLAQVIEIWSSARIEPAGLSLSPGTARDEAVLQVVGDVPAPHAALGLDTAWNHPHHYEASHQLHDVADLPALWSPAEGSTVDTRPHDIIMRLLPQHPGRPAGVVLRLLRWSDTDGALDALISCATVAQRFGELLTVVTLATCSRLDPSQVKRLAPVLLDAWREDRLSASDLAMGWRSPMWEQLNLGSGRKTLERKPAKVLPLLTLFIEAEAPALAWPLLSEIAEGLAVAEKIPATASTIFETVLSLLPEVPHKVELPNICALADRRGKSKAITLARAIKEKM